uniref:Uncharacterized protein n=1 Tax=Salix viminalis TaxID=40686 RepID=A0A6N2NLX1_SALVM
MFRVFACLGSFVFEQGGRGGYLLLRPGRAEGGLWPDFGSGLLIVNCCYQGFSECFVLFVLLLRQNCCSKATPRVHLLAETFFFASSSFSLQTLLCY